MSVKVIAEAGINHNCNIQNAFELVDAAIDAGADIVKFQAAVPEEVVTKQGEMAKYQIKNIGKKLTQLEMTKKIHFDLSSFKEIYYYSKKKELHFVQQVLVKKQLIIYQSLICHSGKYLLGK